MTVGFFSSCEDYIDSPTKSSTDDSFIFSNVSSAEQAVMGIYNVLMEDRGYRNRVPQYMGVNTDIEVHSNSSQGATSTNRTALAVYAQTANLADGFNDSDGKNPWGRIYAAIERANLCITNIKKFGNPEGNAQMGYLLGEALTIRAMLYYDLVKWWGDVPARFEPTSFATINVPKSDRDVVLKQILTDLDEAQNYLYWPKENAKTNTVERISKTFAKGLRARVALFAGGYGLRPDGGTGEVRKSTDPELESSKMYQIAKTECWDIITQGTNQLIPFETIFKNQCQDITTAGLESIFEFPFSDSRGQWLSYLGLRREGADKYASITIKGEVGVSVTQYYAYQQGDLRRDITCPIFFWGSVTDRTTALQECTKVNKVYNGKWRSEWTARKIESTDDGINYCVMRYSDILLMYAEADLMLGGNSGLEYVNKVRRRGFGKPVDSPAPGIDLTSLTLEDIQKERALEFCGENIRKYDLMRWGILKKQLNETKSDLALLRDGTGKYSSISPSILWKVNPDNKEALIFWGVNPGEELPQALQDSITKYNYDYKVYRDFPSKDPSTLSESDLTKYNRVMWVLGEVDGFTSGLGLGTGWLVNIWLAEKSNDVPLIDNVAKYLYADGIDPDKRQILPIMNAVIQSSQGVLVNDYGY